MQKFLDLEVPAEYLEGLEVAVQELIKKGRREGHITNDELMTAFPHAESDLDTLDDIYTRLMKLNIEIVDNLDKDEIFK